MQKLLNWIDDRFPLTLAWETLWGKYVAPKNFNFWYSFGALAGLVLVMQIVTSILLAMNYKPDITKAFESIEYIMRDVKWGWLIRYVHSTGASMFFVVVYLHMFRALLYGSYRKPRELLWIFGCLVYLALMAEAFFGYLLPWNQMSYWGAQVIVNLFSTIPLIGDDLAVWVRGDFTISDITLNRFFAFHVIALPPLLLGLVGAHLIALHTVGSNNPDGIEIKQQPRDAPEAFTTCVVCAMEVPLDEAVVPEATDRLVYLFGFDCYARWLGAAAISFPSLLAGPRL